jgi:hypothetical protein
MSSVANHVYTPERDLIAQRLVLAAMTDEDNVERVDDIVNQAESCVDMTAVALLLAEQLAGQLTAGFEDSDDCYFDLDAWEVYIAKAAEPIEARICALEHAVNAREAVRSAAAHNPEECECCRMYDAAASEPVIVDGVRLPADMPPEVWAMLTPQAQ